MDGLSVNDFPKHIAVIMDGNGRWAAKRCLPRVYGHRRGVEAARKLIKNCIDYSLTALTLFAFSSENWQRPKAEVKLLMSILNNLLQTEVAALHQRQVKLNVIGEITALNYSLQQAIANAQTITKDNTGLQLNIAINYGGRWDIVQAAKQVASLVEAGKLALDDITEDVFNQHICLHDLPAPDLLIRTGEQRISNFLLWQIAYAEIFFTSTLWPDFAEADLQQALEFYCNRQRRFGRCSTSSSSIPDTLSIA